MINTLKSFAIDYSYEYDTFLNDYSKDTGMSGGELAAWIIAGAAVYIFMVAAMWAVFKKAGRPGWAAIIPIYNTYITIKIAGKSGWWLLGFFVPFINIVAVIYIFYNLAKVFGKGVGYMLLLIFLPIIGWPMLGWGSAKYKKPRAA